MVEEINTLPANRYKVAEIVKPTTEVLNELAGTDYTIISIVPSVLGTFYVTMEYDPVYGRDHAEMVISGMLMDDDDDDDILDEVVPVKKGQH